MNNQDPQPSHSRAHPPETLEGWYALHQIFTVDRVKPQSQHEFRRSDATPSVASAPQGVVSSRQESGPNGWSTWVRLIGSKSDLMAMHFAPTLDAIGEAQGRTRECAKQHELRLDYSFLSVTEAGLYHLTAELAREAGDRGGQVGDETYSAEVSRRAVAERDSPHVRRRLYPEIPPGMPYVSFYPMSKRRDPGQNWYALSLDERSRLMHTHGKTGRRYAGRVVQIITGAIGFDAWEWGVTLFAGDPLDFKKLVTDMRFDEVSANYADFGEFYVGKLIPQGELTAVVETL